MSTELTKKDFDSGLDVRWCPGCGDYAILAQIQQVLPLLSHKKEDYVFMSGIGCSSRFPYYMNTYGFHTIHGRAPALSTGVKVANPDLSVWMVTGDGDALSIGGNHLLHVLRRNVNINILLFDNRIYGLTKGQYSPTSDTGTVTKSTPYGSIDNPVDPVQFALGAGASFVARTSDRDLPHMRAMLQAADEHQGTSLVHILQNCIVFNDKVWEDYTDKKRRSEHAVYLQDGEPMIYGNETDKSIGINDSLVPIQLAPGDSATLTHNPRSLAQALTISQFQHNGLPMGMGVLYENHRDIYEESVVAMETDLVSAKGAGDLNELYRSGETWKID